MRRIKQRRPIGGAQGKGKKPKIDPQVAKIQKQAQQARARQAKLKEKILGITTKNIDKKERIKAQNLPYFGEARRRMNGGWLARIGINGVDTLIEFTPTKRGEEIITEVSRVQTTNGKYAVEFDQRAQKWLNVKLKQLYEESLRKHRAEIGSTDWIEGW